METIIGIVAGILYLALLFGIPTLIIWSIISNSKKKKVSKKKIEPVIEWAESKGYPLPDKPYGVSFNFAIILGFLFGLIPGLILVIISTKRKDNYDKEIRQLTTKWIDAGKPLPLPVEKQINRNKNIKFKVSKLSSKDDIYNKFISEVERIGYKNIIENSEINSYELEESFLGGLEFIINDKKDNTLFLLSGKKIDNDYIEWSGEL